MKNIIFRIILLVIILFLFSTSYLYSANGEAGDFILEGIDGKEVVLSNLLEDKIAVLVFWTTRCSYCIAEIPHIEKFYKKNKNKVAIIGINIGESKARVVRFAKKRKISYPIVLDFEAKVAKAYKVAGVPTIVAVNRDSTILYFGHSIDEMKKKLGL